MNRKFLALIAAILCLSMLFVGCKKETTEEDPVTEATEEVIDTAKDIEAILNVFAQKDSSALTEQKIPDVKAEILKLLADVDFEITEMTMNGQTLYSPLIYQNSIAQAGVNVSDKSWLLIGPNLEFLTVYYDSDSKKYNAESEIFTDYADMLENVSAQLPSGSTLEELMSQNKLTVSEDFPMPTASDFEHMGGHSYKLKNSYFTTLYEYTLEQMGKVVGASIPADVKEEYDATYNEAINGMNPAIVFTLENDVVTTMTVSVDISDAYCKEMFGSDSVDYKDDMYLKASIVFDVANYENAPIKAELDAYIPTGGYYSSGSDSSSEIRGVTMSKIKMEAMLNLSKLGSTNDTILDFSMDVETDAQYYVDGAYSETESAKSGGKQTTTAKASLTTCDKAGTFAFDLSAKQAYDGEEETIAFSAKARFVDVPDMNVPAEVKAYQARLNAYAEKADAIDAKINSLRNSAALQEYLAQNKLDDNKENNANVFLYLEEYGLYFEISYGINGYARVEIPSWSGETVVVSVSANGNITHKMVSNG